MSGVHFKTLSFYESLIDATIAPIVAADARGEIVLFNRSAENLSGRRCEEVVGKMTLDQLLHETHSTTLWHQLASELHGGCGRLVRSQTELIHKNGEVIPVRMSASSVGEPGAEPSAAVLILTDLREQLRVEARLAEARKQLAFTEKQAVLAEIAGTAAHELNQPLTSILAHAELLRRQSGDGSHEAQVASVLTREAERMAEIVRKIGKITRYETTTYVGTQRIFDLDRAVDVGSAEDG